MVPSCTSSNSRLKSSACFLRASVSSWCRASPTLSHMQRSRTCDFLQQWLQQHVRFYHDLYQWLLPHPSPCPHLGSLRVLSHHFASLKCYNCGLAQASWASIMLHHYTCLLMAIAKYLWSAQEGCWFCMPFDVFQFCDHTQTECSWKQGCR